MVPLSFAQGNFDSAVLDATTVTVSGWALSTGRGDQDVLPFVPIRLTGSNGLSSGTGAYTDIDRPDVGAAFPGTGIRHGFNAVIPRNGVTCPCTVWFDTTGTNGTTGWLDENDRPFGTIGTRLPLIGSVMNVG
jgi:hypothetical protein